MRYVQNIFLAFTILATMVVGQSGKPTVAILDFDGQGVDAAVSYTHLTLPTILLV